MKKIKIIALFLALITLITSLNLGMLFTSNADDTIEIDSASDFEVLVNKINSNSGVITINLTKNIDASTIGAIDAIDATNKTIIFDGGSHLIKNLDIIGGGLFTNVGANSSFSDLGMYNCTISDFAADSKEGYGFLAGKMDSGSIENCFVDGTITVYGTPKYLGGLVGQFGGSMVNSYAMTDIYTDGSYVGGLIGEFTGSANSISACYSTGSIDNDSRDHIGGLIGYSQTACVSDSYTTTCILNPYADTVKSIGVINGLSVEHNVYYDENLSLQKQGDMDPHRCSPAEIRDKFRLSTNWVIVDPKVDANGAAGQGCYPQLSVFYNSSVNSFKRISAISSAVVDIDRGDGLTTGREFTVVSTTSRYSFATLTNNIDNTGTNANSFLWRISGGVDEYYFDPATATESGYPTNSGSTLNGLSGNTFDTRTGKYLFVNTGDVKFTASSGSFERDIYVHVTTYDKQPYFKETRIANIGTGTQSDPFIINSLADLDMIRVYCLDDETGKYSYKLNFPVNNSVYVIDMSSIASWKPIVGMKGNFYGNSHIIANLKVSEDNEGGAGLFATISNTAYLYDFHISEANIAVTEEANAGLLAGSVKNATIEGVMATGIVSGASNAGGIAGEAYGTTTVTKTLTMGIIEGVGNVGGIFGYTGSAENNDSVSIVDAYSCAIVKGGQRVGGLIGSGNGDITTSLYTGMLSPGLGGIRYGLTGGDGQVTNAYFDWQAAGVHNSGSVQAKKTSELIASSGFALNENWHYYRSTTNTDNYLQLTFFTAKRTTLSKYNGRTARTSMASAVPIIFSDSSADGSSISFTEAKYNRKYEYDAPREILYPVFYSGAEDGYSVPTSYSNVNVVNGNGAYNNEYYIRLNNGGEAIYKLGYRYPDYPGDTRYVLFNVRSINVHYKFEYSSDDENDAYNSDMANMGLTDISNDMGSSYGAILDSTITEDFDGLVTLKPAGDALSFKMTHGAKYSYIVEAYEDALMTKPIPVNIGNSVSIATLEDVYINIVIEKNDFPWGIYRMSCS